MIDWRKNKEETLNLETKMTSNKKRVCFGEDPEVESMVLYL